MIKFLSVFSLFCALIFFHTIGVHAETVINVDGSTVDWNSSDAQCMLTYTDSQGSDFTDVERICVTDSYSSDGYFYMLIEFVEDRSSSARNRVWLQNANVILNVDTDSDGVAETQIDFLNDPQNEVYGIISLPYLEVRIDYDLVDPDGDRQFSFFIDSYWRNSVEDRVPYDEGTTVDYSIDPATGSPRAVRMLAQNAVIENGGVRLNWVTASERANAGFHVYRFEPQEHRWIRLTDALIPGLGDTPFGRQYTFMDPQGLPGDRYTIQDVEFTGKKRSNGVIQAKSSRHLLDEYIPAMTTKLSRPFDLFSRLKKLFATRSGPKNRFCNDAGYLYSTDAQGVYRLSTDALHEAHLSPKKTKLTMNGNAVPVTTDRKGLLFYAAPTADRYADYDMVVAEPGHRRSVQMKRQRVRSRCRSIVDSLPVTRTFEKNVNYYVATPIDDPFFWSMAFSGSPAKMPFRLTGLVGGGARMSVSLVGFAASTSGDDHIAHFSINGVPVGEWRWNGKGEEAAALTIPDGVLQLENQLSVSVDGQRPMDMLSVDKMTVTYQRYLALEDGQLLFDAAVNQCVSVAVDATDTVVLDVTDAGNPVRLVGSVTDGHRIQFGVPRAKDGVTVRKLLVADLNQAMSPVPERSLSTPLQMNQASSAAYLVITHPLFADAAARLAEYHGASMETFVAETDDIYNRYTGGRPHPRAIREFIRELADSGNLRYVLLLGASTVDSNDVMGIGDTDYIPTYFYRTFLMGYESASDTGFIDGIPHVALGRLAARDQSEANRVVDKLVSWYETGAPSAGASVYVADREDGSERSFVSDMNDQVASSGVFQSQAETLVLDNAGTPTAALRMLLNEGVDFVNYHGHAYVSGWSSPEVANLAFADSLENDHLFFLMSWSCFDGMFPSPWDESLAWQFVANPTAGAYGALAGSSLSNPAYVELFANQVTVELANGADTIGDAVAAARKQISRNLSKGALDTYHTYNLLADPAAPNPWSR